MIVTFNLGDQRLAENVAGIELDNIGLRYVFLGVTKRKQCGTILCTTVWSLAVKLGGLCATEKNTCSREP